MDDFRILLFFFKRFERLPLSNLFSSDSNIIVSIFVSIEFHLPDSLHFFDPKLIQSDY